MRFNTGVAVYKETLEPEVMMRPRRYLHGLSNAMISFTIGGKAKLQ